MTLKELARKYDIPYNIVYEASYKVTPLTYSRTEREYPEKETLEEVRRLVNSRIRHHSTLLNNMLAVREKLKD